VITSTPRVCRPQDRVPYFSDHCLSWLLRLFRTASLVSLGGDGAEPVVAGPVTAPAMMPACIEPSSARDRLVWPKRSGTASPTLQWSPMPIKRCYRISTARRQGPRSAGNTGPVSAVPAVRISARRVGIDVRVLAALGSIELYQSCLRVRNTLFEVLSSWERRAPPRRPR
jgi:hypothetical protein